jgi:hypothetical protein
MVAALRREPGGWRGVWLALVLLAVEPGCSSDSPAAAPDAGSPDAALMDDASADSPADDASTDGRGGTGGTVRGGMGGSNRGGTGGTTTPPDAAPEAEAAPPTPPPNDTCQEARVIPLAPHADVAATTRGARHDLDLSCGAGGGDVFFSFTLTERSLVYADTFGAAFDTILAFTDACGDSDGGVLAGTEPSCVDDACGTKASQVVAVLPVGKHYLVLSGRGEGGDVTLHFEHAPVGTGQVAALGLGASVASGTTSGDGRLSLCEAGGPEDSYWWTSCQGFTGGPFTASTCSNTMYDSMLALQIPRTGALVCNDDACMLQAAITTSLPPGAGLHVLTVDGFTPRHHGAYSLSTTRP